MDDKTILDRITTLVAQEHELLEHEANHGKLPEGEGQLEQIQATLDQCWDLLRQRRAFREYGMDPDQAAPRPINVVEGYKQ